MTRYNDLDDDKLVLLLKEDSRDAFTEIYRRYFQVLFAHAYKKLHSDEEAKDLIQEVFTNLWTNRKVFNVNSSFAAYIYTAVRSRILNHIAHEDVKSRYATSLENFVVYENADTDYRIREKELLEYVEKEIQALPKKMREVFELSRKGNLSHKEIAEQLHISEQTVSKQISNALKILRISLGELLLVLFFLNCK